MRLFILFFLSMVALQSSAQLSGAANTNSSSTVQGSIITFPIQSLTVEQINSAPIQFVNADDYNSGKQYPNYLKLTVVSTVPWLVTVRAIDGQFGSINSSSNMPVSLLNLRGHNNSGSFGPIALSNASQTFLVGLNNQIQSVFFVDLSLNPGWNYSGGSYSTNLLFTLTPQ